MRTETQELPSEHQETLFHCEGTEHLHRLPREAVGSPSLEIFETCLDMVLGGWP